MTVLIVERSESDKRKYALDDATKRHFRFNKHELAKLTGGQTVWREDVAFYLEQGEGAGA